MTHVNQDGKQTTGVGGAALITEIDSCNIKLTEESEVDLRVWAMEETLTILAGAEALRWSRRSIVNRKWPKWFVPNCISKPSLVSQRGHIITPVSQ